MTSNDFAPVKRATLFFGAMGLLVATLTFGAGLQQPVGESSAAVAEVKLRQNLPSDRAIADMKPARELRPVPASAGARLQARMRGPEEPTLR